MNICYDQSFWEEFEILMFDRDRMDKTGEDTDNIISLLGVNTNDKILDVCCGFGRYTNCLALKGYIATGIDITQSYLQKAKKNAPKKNPPSYIEGDIVKFNEIEKYDFALNLFTSFGLMDDEEDELIALRNIYNALNPGGKYLIDIQGKELLCRDFEKNIWFESGDTKVFLEYKIENSFTLLNSRWLYYKDEKMHERSFNTRIYSALELAGLMAEAGFENVEIFGDLKGNPYDMNAERLIAVGTKS